MENGKATLVDALPRQIGFGSTEFHVLRPGKHLHGRYLFYMLWNHLFRFSAVRNMTGTAGQKRVPADFLRRYKIPLPPLEEQKRIAAILDKADAIRKKRQRAIEMLDEFLRATFLDMFGDPITNPKGWELLPLGSLSERFSDGPFGSNLKSSHYVKEGVRVIRLQNIGVGEFIDEDKAYVSREHFQSLISHQCLPGDILIGTLGSPNLRACVLPEHINEALNKADCIQMRPDLNQVTPEYVMALLNQPGTLALASHLLHGQTRTRISMGTLRNLEVPVPPLEIQQHFGSIVRIMKTKIKLSEYNAKIEALKCLASLQSRAFRGEL